MIGHRILPLRTKNSWYSQIVSLLNIDMFPCCFTHGIISRNFLINSINIKTNDQHIIQNLSSIPKTGLNRQSRLKETKI